MEHARQREGRGVNCLLDTGQTEAHDLAARLQPRDLPPVLVALEGMG